MVYTEAALTTLTLIVSAPGVSFDYWIAARKVLWMPLEREESHRVSLIFTALALPVLLTVKVAAWAGSIVSMVMDVVTSTARTQ